MAGESGAIIGGGGVEDCCRRSINDDEGIRLGGVIYSFCPDPFFMSRDDGVLVDF